MNHPAGSADHSAAAHGQAQQELLALARQTLELYLTSGSLLTWSTDHPWYLAPAAVFVTLRQRPRTAGELGELRGCIGQVEAVMPLYQAVQEAIIKAATVDPRFVPVTLRELPDLVIEISVLSSFRPVTTLDDVQVGRDGLFIVGHYQRGLLLPDVATMYGLSTPDFLRAVCRKAGLPANAWPQTAELFAFSTESFDDAVPLSD